MSAGGVALQRDGVRLATRHAFAIPLTVLGLFGFLLWAGSQLGAPFRDSCRTKMGEHAALRRRLPLQLRRERVNSRSQFGVAT